MNGEASTRFFQQSGTCQQPSAIMTRQVHTHYAPLHEYPAVSYLQARAGLFPHQFPALARPEAGECPSQARWTRGKIGQPSSIKPACLCSHVSAFFALKSSSQHPPLSDSQPTSFREAPPASRPPASGTPVNPERKDRTHQAASVASKHSQQHQLCLGPPTPLNLENQADFHDSNQLPDTWNRRNVITPFANAREALEAFLIKADIIPLTGHLINQLLL